MKKIFLFVLIVNFAFSIIFINFLQNVFVLEIIIVPSIFKIFFDKLINSNISLLNSKISVKTIKSNLQEK